MGKWVATLVISLVTEPVNVTWVIPLVIMGKLTKVTFTSYFLIRMPRKIFSEAKRAVCGGVLVIQMDYYMNSNTLIIMITIIIDDKIAIIVISKNAHVYYSTNSYHDSYKLLVSSTEQGRWRKFNSKNRKPIGRVGCRDSRMAERIHWWTERWVKLCFLEWLQWLQWSPHGL